MRRFTLLIILLFTSKVALANTCVDFDSLTFEQKFNLHKSYNYGSADNYGYTLAAIALIESSAGRFRLNIRSNDLGLYQVNATTAQNVIGVTNYYRQVELHQRLIYDDLLGAKIAIDVLEHFRRGRPLTNQVWQEVIMSYNEGYRWRSDENSRKKAQEYLDTIRGAVVLLRNCLRRDLEERYVETI